MTLAQRLRQYIQTELNDCACYRALAKEAPGEDAAVLRSFSGRELALARALQDLYTATTGACFTPAVTAQLPQGSYRARLLARVREESEAARAYAQQALCCRGNDCLREVCLRAQADKNAHALTLLALAADAREDAAPQKSAPAQSATAKGTDTPALHIAAQAEELAAQKAAARKG